MFSIYGALELASTVGISVSEFWEITPHELNIVAKAYATRKKEEQKASIYQAYLISRWVWAKKIDIEKYIKSDNKKKAMSDEEMLAQAKMLNALFGGEVKHN